VVAGPLAGEQAPDKGKPPPPRPAEASPAAGHQGG
jgi:hypothetical protein